MAIAVLKFEWWLLWIIWIVFLRSASVLAMQSKWKNGLIYDYVVVYFVLLLLLPFFHRWLFCCFWLEKEKGCKWECSFCFVLLDSLWVFSFMMVFGGQLKTIVRRSCQNDSNKSHGFYFKIFVRSSYDN